MTSQIIKPIQKKTKILLSGILLLTVIIYSSAINNGFVTNYDDNIYILQNDLAKDLSWNGIKNMFNPFTDFTLRVTGHYHPLTFLTWAIEYNLFGLNAIPWHIDNIIFHLLNVILVFYLIFLLSKSEVVALIVAALFSVHPMNVESVAWITERKNVLFTLFFLAAVVAYIQYVKTKIAQPEKKSLLRKYYFTTIILFVIDLFCKNQAVMFPFMILLVDYFYGQFNWKSIWKSVPFFAISLAFGLLALIGHYKGGMINQVPIYTFIDRIFMASYALVFYLIKMFAPLNLSAVYYYPDKINGLLPWEYYLSFFILAAIVAGIFFVKKFKKELVFGSLFFLINIFLVMQLIPICNTIAADRYVYVPYIGFFFIIGKFFTSEKITDNKNLKIYSSLGFFVILFIFSILTFQRNKMWKDGEILFSDIIIKNPQQSFGYYGRGTVRTEKGNVRGAMEDFTNAIRYNPSDSSSYYNRGNLKRNPLNDYKGAVEDYTAAIRINAGFAVAYFNRAVTKLEMGNVQGALDDYNKVIELHPAPKPFFGNEKKSSSSLNKNILADAYNNRGYLKQHRLNQLQDALSDYNHSIAIQSDNHEAYFNRGLARVFLKDYQGAMNDYDAALRLKPDYAECFNNKGNLKQYVLNDLQGALNDYEEAIRHNPQFALAYLNRGLVKIQLRISDGCNDLSRAVQLGNADAANYLKQYCQ